MENIVLNFAKNMTKIPISSKMNCISEICNSLIKEKTFLIDNEQFFFNMKTHYTPVKHSDAAVIIRTLISTENNALISSSKTSEIIKILSETPDIQCSFQTYFSKYDMYINLKNGVFDIKNNKMLKHDSKYHFNYILDFNYYPDKTIEDAPYFKKYCSSSLDKEKTKLLLEIFGYCISSLTGAKKAFFLVGSHSSGKSVMLNVLEKVIGEEYVSNIPFYRMGDRFCLGQYNHKRLNACKETSKKPMKNPDIFKSLISNERMYAELKNINGYSFYPTLKFITASNNFPSFSEVDDAILDRLCIIHYANTIERELWDKHLEEHLLSEKDIIFSLSIDSLNALIDRNFIFSESKESNDFFISNTQFANSVKNFINEECSVQNGNKIFTAEFYKAYFQFCTSNLIKPVEKQEFINCVKNCCQTIEYKKIRIGDKTLMGFKGVDINEKK